MEKGRKSNWNENNKDRAWEGISRSGPGDTTPRYLRLRSQGQYRQEKTINRRKQNSIRMAYDNETIWIWRTMKKFGNGQGQFYLIFAPTSHVYNHQHTVSVLKIYAQSLPTRQETIKSGGVESTSDFTSPVDRVFVQEMQFRFFFCSFFFSFILF